MNLQSQLSQILSSSRVHIRIILWSSVLTGLCLGGTLSLPFWYGLFLYYAPASIRAILTGYLPPHITPDYWLQGIALGGVVWGLALARLSKVQPLWRLGLAGGLGVLLAGIMATTFPFHRILGLQGPQHIQWIMDLVIMIGLGGGITALALGLALRWGRLSLGLALGVMLASAIPALIVALSLDAIGIRWGAGNANMAKVVGLAFPVSTLSAGAVIGWYLARFGHEGC